MRFFPPIAKPRVSAGPRHGAGWPRGPVTRIARWAPLAALGLIVAARPSGAVTREVTSAPFSLTFDYIGNAWKTNDAATAGNFTFSPAVAGTKSSDYGLLVVNGTVSNGFYLAQSGKITNDGNDLKVTLTGAWNASLPADATATPDYQIKVEVTGISVNFAGRVANSRPNLYIRETTGGTLVQQAGPVQAGTTITYEPYLNTASNYTNASWDPTDSYRAGTSAARTFDMLTPGYGTPFSAADGIQLTGRVTLQYRSTLLNAGPTWPDGSQAYGVTVCSGAVKLRPGGLETVAAQRRSSSVAIDAGGNEYESAQVVVYSETMDLTGVQLQASALTSASGVRIEASNVLFAPVGFVTNNATDAAEQGWWPDPILPFLTGFTIRRYDVQPLWYRVFVPAGTPAGLYNGTVTIQPQNAASWTVPVQVRVRDFTLPRMPRLRMTIGSGAEDFLLSYKLLPTNLYGFSTSAGWQTRFDKWAKQGVRGWCVHYFSPSMLDQTTKLATQAQLDLWLGQIQQRLDAASVYGMREEAFLYMFDEAGADWFPAIRQISNAVRARFPDLAVVTSSTAWNETDPNMPNVTDWVIDAPNYYKFFGSKVANARTAGKKVWWYTANLPLKPLANYGITHDAIEARLYPGFMSYDYGADGIIYYCLNLSSYRTPITTGPYTAWQVVDDGHNHLTPLGPQAEQPLPSIRLENIRDGLEDYDYLYLAKARRDELRARGISDSTLASLESQITPYLAPGNSLVSNYENFSRDPAALSDVRKLLADYIERAGSYLPRATWAERHFSEAEMTDPAVSGDLADPDADHAPNLLEYALNTNPLPPSPTVGLFIPPALTAPITTRAGSRLELTYRKDVTKTDIQYKVQQSTDLLLWNIVGVNQELLATDGNIQTWRSWVELSGTGARFLRLKIMPPP